MSSDSTNNSKERQELIERMGFLGQMFSTETAHFHHTAAAKNGVSVTDSKTVSVLMQEGPMTAGQLAERLSLTTGAVTSVIDRLVDCGIARRDPDPNDRRKVMVAINNEKIKDKAKTYESIGRSFTELLSTYSTEELHFLVRYYGAAIELLKQETKKLAENK